MILISKNMRPVAVLSRSLLTVSMAASHVLPTAPSNIAMTRALRAVLQHAHGAHCVVHSKHHLLWGLTFALYCHLVGHAVIHTHSMDTCMLQVSGKYKSRGHEDACGRRAVWNGAGLCCPPDFPTSLQSGCACHQAPLHAPPPECLGRRCPNE